MDSSRSLYWEKSLLWCLWASASTKASRLFKLFTPSLPGIIHSCSHLLEGNGDPVLTKYPKIHVAPSTSLIWWHELLELVCSALRAESGLGKQAPELSGRQPVLHPVLRLGESQSSILHFQHCLSQCPPNSGTWDFQPTAGPTRTWPESVSTPLVLISQVQKHFTVTASNYPLLHSPGYPICTSCKKSKCLHNYMILHTWIPHGSLCYDWMKNVFPNAIAISRLKKSVKKIGYIYSSILLGNSLFYTKPGYLEYLGVKYVFLKNSCSDRSLVRG